LNVQLQPETVHKPDAALQRFKNRIATRLGNRDDMPVRYGIVCDRCRKLHFISDERKVHHIRYDRKRGEFTARCIPPCPNTIYFQRRMLMPYVVPDEAVQRGYADVDDCRPVAMSG